MSNEYRLYADMLEQFVDMEDSDFLGQLGLSIRTWKDFPYLDDLRVAYDHLNEGKSHYARHIILGVVGELLAEKQEWTAEEILKREG